MVSSIFVRLMTPLSCVAFAVSPAAVQAASPAAAVQELLEADRQYSAEGEGDNIADAIGAMMASDSRMPTPQGNFAKGKQGIIDSLRANPTNANATAEWAPVRGGISADGLQGFTYGFMTVHRPGQDDQRLKYLSYWKRLPEGWRVHGYKRALSPPGDVSTALRSPALPSHLLPERPSPQLVDKYRDSLAAREKAFSDRAHEVGLRQAFLEFGSADAMNFGGGSDFTFGNVAISEGLPPDVPSPVIWGPDEGVTVSSTGDLGITFGYIRPTDQVGAFPFFT
ncbi:MAG TPA: nuclear transport factor 2 family protein, partial [Sphingomicrobium sp.]|nr:nuclear transport factor 2 family protein [Sphingomicrobium sp.]